MEHIKPKKIQIVDILFRNVNQCNFELLKCYLKMVSV